MTEKQHQNLYPQVSSADSIVNDLAPFWKVVWWQHAQCVHCDNSFWSPNPSATRPTSGTPLIFLGSSQQYKQTMQRELQWSQLLGTYKKWQLRPGMYAFGRLFEKFELSHGFAGQPSIRCHTAWIHSMIYSDLQCSGHDKKQSNSVLAHVDST